MSRRNDHTRDELRELIISSAQQIILSEGMGALTARALASRIGYTVGTLYNVFYNLDDILLHVNGRTLDALQKTLYDIPDQYTRPTRILIEFAREYIRFAKENPALWRLVFASPPETKGLPEWYREKLQGLVSLIEQLVLPLARPEHSDNARGAAHVLWAGLNGICLLMLNNKLPVNDERPEYVLGESLIVHYLEGFLSRAHVRALETEMA